MKGHVFVLWLVAAYVAIFVGLSLLAQVASGATPKVDPPANYMFKLSSALRSSTYKETIQGIGFICRSYVARNVLLIRCVPTNKAPAGAA